MRVSRHDARAEVPPEPWDSTWASRRFYASSGWLRVADETADLPPWYLLAEHGRTLYGLPCYHIATSSPFPFCRVDRVVQRLDSTGATGERLLPSVLLGARNPGHQGFGVAQAPTPAHAAAAADALLNRAEADARGEGLHSVAMLYVDDDDAVAHQVLRSRGYVGFPHAYASLLATPPGGRTGYLDALPPRHAGTVRRELRRLEAAEVHYDVVEPDESVLAEVDALERNLNVKYAGTYDDEAVARLRRSMARHLDGLLVVRARMGGRTVGSLLAIRWRDELYARTVGFAYDEVGKLPVYFGLLFYYLVEYAQDNGIRLLSYATGTEDAKRRRGCRLIRQHAYVKAFDPATDERLRMLVQKVSTEASCKQNSLLSGSRMM